MPTQSATAHDPTPTPPTPHVDPDAQGGLEDGIALAMSGGGYRAMLFHVGTLWRLNEAGLLPGLASISSVSGGSITAGVLGLSWPELGFQDKVAAGFVRLVVEPLRELARHTIDIGGTFLGTARAYRKYLFGNKTLQALPDTPRFVLNATNVQSGALWRFSKKYMGDYRVGRMTNPDVELAVAVEASSAFPPVLSPTTLPMQADLVKPDPGSDLNRLPFTAQAVLSDGGVYDNFGLETIFKRYKTILVSNGGAKIEAEEDPAHDWPRHALRVLDLIDNQVRSLRERVLIAAFMDGSRKGAYWGIRTDIKDYELADALECPLEHTLELAAVPTRLASMDERLQEKLINWGYAVCDAALRKYVITGPITPPKFPYEGGVSP
jgi:NTE family protein